MKYTPTKRLAHKNDFGRPWGSKVTPWVPKVAPGVPKVPPQGPPGLKKEPFWYPKVIPRGLWVLVFAYVSPPLFAILLPAAPLAPSTHQPIDTSTHQPIAMTSHQDWAGGMRGAIE